MTDDHVRQHAGSIVFMGSVPTVVDEMSYPSHSTLYQWVTRSARTMPLNTRELVTLFGHYSIYGKWDLTLDLETLFGGWLHAYERACPKELLHPDATTQHAVDQAMTADIQFDAKDAAQFSSQLLGRRFALVLHAVLAHHRKCGQVKAAQEELGDRNEALRAMQTKLCARYDIARPAYSIRRDPYRLTVRLSHGPLPQTGWC